MRVQQIIKVRAQFDLFVVEGFDNYSSTRILKE